MSKKGSNLGRFLARGLAAAVAACGLILLLTHLLAAPRVRAHRRRYRLAPYPGEALSGGELRLAARRLRGRLAALSESLELKSWQVRALPPDRLHLRFRTAGDPGEVLFWTTLSGRPAFHLIHPDPQVLERGGEPPPGYERKVYTRYAYRLSRPGDLSGERHPYLVRTRPLLAVDRFGGVELETRGLHQETVVTFRFREEQRERFRALAAQNIGREMALVVDGRLFLPPGRLGRSSAGGAVQMRGYFYNPPLRKLVRVLRGGALPGRLEEVERPAE